MTPGEVLVHNLQEVDSPTAIMENSKHELPGIVPRSNPLSAGRRMASLANDPVELAKVVEALRLSAYVDSASFVILVYDYMLTFEDERTLIWNSDWSLTKLLFLLTRYLPFMDLSISTTRHFKHDMSPEACLLNYKIGGSFVDFGIFIAELILVLRTWAIWEKKRIITIALLVWTAINLVLDFVFVELYLDSVKFTPVPKGITGCLTTSGNPLLVGAWAVLMVYEAGILGLMILKGTQMYKEYVHRELRSSALYKAIFRDGAIFYVYIFALSVANVIIISRLPRELAALLTSFERVIHAVLTERLLIALRRAIREPHDQSYNLETIRFDKSPKGIVDTETGAGTSTVMSSNLGQWSYSDPSTSITCAESALRS
ncbi:uncharacterized protein FOMMEDRAFT_161584 [Fomitiporia mediterranea MF3/22]|uniref:uncharacterized protein n=1 Tax=Fomitiporia mediterranea (strain MF3/22) TaxID=694068 RepID=UPI00044076B9|nr:uncharacterized protein FOMMEDRAFT_161584 [Fomitiporia mediterranea MF3/22]EJC98751.1 hypothetical protein FOMMEDRAFT_161584 [Fomitiporia mediterranea MF3/22]